MALEKCFSSRIRNTKTQEYELLPLKLTRTCQSVIKNDIDKCFSSNTEHIKTQGNHKNLRMIASNIYKKQAPLMILTKWFSSSRQVWRVWSLPGANIVNTSSAKAEPLVFLRKSKSRHCIVCQRRFHGISTKQVKIELQRGDMAPMLMRASKQHLAKRTHHSNTLRACEDRVTGGGVEMICLEFLLGIFSYLALPCVYIVCIIVPHSVSYWAWTEGLKWQAWHLCQPNADMCPLT